MKYVIYMDKFSKCIYKPVMVVFESEINNITYDFMQLWCIMIYYDVLWYIMDE